MLRTFMSYWVWMLLVHMWCVCLYVHQILRKKLLIEPLKNELPIFLSIEIYLSNLFCIFLKTGFSCKAFDCDTYDHPLILSDQADIFITDTLKYFPEVESTVLISDIPIRIYRVLNFKNLVLCKTFMHFVYKKKTSEIFKKSSKIPLTYSHRWI